MIGRKDDLRPFELIRWARDRASVEGLSQLEAHVLLLLATYANNEGKAWPSIKRLALDCGLRPTQDGRNSAVSVALQRLGDRRLIWTNQAGRGRPAVRELLFNPSVSAEGSSGSSHPDSRTAEPVHNHSAFREAEQQGHSETPSAVRAGEPLPSGLANQNYQRTAKETAELPNSNGQMTPSGYAEGVTSRPEEGREVREAIVRSLEEARQARGDAA